MKKLFKPQNLIAIAIVIASLILTYVCIAHINRGSAAPGGEMLIPVIGGLLAACVTTAAGEHKKKVIRKKRIKTAAHTRKYKSAA